MLQDPGQTAHSHSERGRGGRLTSGRSKHKRGSFYNQMQLRDFPALPLPWEGRGGAGPGVPQHVCLGCSFAWETSSFPGVLARGLHRTRDNSVPAAAPPAGARETGTPWPLPQGTEQRMVAPKPARAHRTPAPRFQPPGGSMRPAHEPLCSRSQHHTLSHVTVPRTQQLQHNRLAVRVHRWACYVLSLGPPTS